MALLGVDEAEEAVAQLDAHRVDRKGGGDRLFHHRRGGDLLSLLGHDLCRGAAMLAGGQERAAAGKAGQQQERDGWDAGQDGHGRHQERSHAERGGIAGQLREQGLVRRTIDAGLGHQHAGRGRDDEGWDLGHQTVADRQQCIGLRGVGHGEVLLRDADDDAADDIDEGDDEARDGVAAHELGCAVHRAEEVAFVLQRLAAGAGILLVDQAGGEIGVDRHLLAGHGVQAEARRHFGDAARTLGDDDEVHQYQDGEHDQADDVVAAHDEAAEGLDDMAGGVGAFMAVRQDEARRSEVER
jgi:hypothetical protein